MNEMTGLHALAVVVAAASALLAGAILYPLVSVNVSIGAQRRRLDHLLRAGQEQAGIAHRLGTRVDLPSSLLDFTPHLMWVRLERDVTQTDMVGWTLISTAAVALLGLAALGIPGLLGGGVLGFYLPYTLLKRKARIVRQRFQQQLPDGLQILATEVAVGASLTVAMERLAESHTTVGRVFARLLADARQHGSLWSGRRPGGLELAARRWGDPQLFSLVVQLDELHQRGVGGVDSLAALGRSMAAQYLGQARRRAEVLDNELLFPLAAFFFTPFLVMILGPVLGMLLAAW